MRAICLLLSVACALPLATRNAEACSCPFPTRALPQDGDSDVPLNVQPTVLARGTAAGTTLELVDIESGELVPGQQFERGRERHSDRILAFTPHEPLAPEHGYQLRYMLGTIELETFEFQTGQLVDLAPPASPTLQSFQPELMLDLQGGNSCVEGYMGHFSRLRQEVSPLPDDSSYYLLELECEDCEHWTRDVVPLIAEAELGALGVSDDGTCGAQPPILSLGAEVCATLVAIDQSGNRSESAKRCATTIECAALLGEFHAPIAECLPPAPSTQPPESPDSGHSGCSSGGGGGTMAGLMLLAAALLLFKS